MRVICLRYVFKNLWENYKSNLQKSMSEIYYMSPKIRETEKFSHGFLEISDSDYIIVSRIFGDIWKIVYVSKNPWEYISVPRISWISRIFGDIPLFVTQKFYLHELWNQHVIRMCSKGQSLPDQQALRNPKFINPILR